MIERFFPNDYVRSIYEIDYNELKRKKIKGLIFDIDNTLVPFDVPSADEKLTAHFKRLQEMGFRICLVSNNNEERVIKFNEHLKVFAIHNARKPMTRNLKKAMELMKTKKRATAIIGDQVFTDVWGGNRIQIHTILVVPVAPRDEWITKIKRGLERKIIHYYMKKKGEDV